MVDYKLKDSIYIRQELLEPIVGFQSENPK